MAELTLTCVCVYVRVCEYVCVVHGPERVSLLMRKSILNSGGWEFDQWSNLTSLAPPPTRVSVTRELRWFSRCVHSHEPATLQQGGGHFCGRLPQIATTQCLLPISATREPLASYSLMACAGKNIIEWMLHKSAEWFRL